MTWPRRLLEIFSPIFRLSECDCRYRGIILEHHFDIRHGVDMSLPTFLDFKHLIRVIRAYIFIGDGIPAHDIEKRFKQV